LATCCRPALVDVASQNKERDHIPFQQRKPRLLLAMVWGNGRLTFREFLSMVVRVQGYPFSPCLCRCFMPTHCSLGFFHPACSVYCSEAEGTTVSFSSKSAYVDSMGIIDHLAQLRGNVGQMENGRITCRAPRCRQNLSNIERTIDGLTLAGGGRWPGHENR